MGIQNQKNRVKRHTVLNRQKRERERERERLTFVGIKREIFHDIGQNNFSGQNYSLLV